MMKLQMQTITERCHPEWARHVFPRASRGALSLARLPHRYAGPAAIVLLFIASFSLAQTGEPLERSKPTATQRVIAAPVDAVRVAAGQSTQVELPFRVAPGYHINSNK